MQQSRFDIGQTLQEALGLQRQGRLREAEKLYARVLKAAPDNFDALHLLGLAKAQSGQMGEAQRLMAAALKSNAQSPDAWINFANVLHALKRDGEALDALDRALALRLAHLSRLRLGEPEQMQRVEIIGRGLENARVKLLGLAQPALLLQAERLLQSLADVEAALLHDQGFWTQNWYMLSNVSG